MSDAHNEHETAIKTPKQLIVAVIAAFVVPIIIIILLVQYVTSEKLVGAGTEVEKGNTAAEAAAVNALTDRIKPVADQGFTFKDVNGPKVLQSGEAVYKATCQACHATGAAGSPKVGDAAAWSARIAQGYDTVLKHAIEGLRAMPAKGGNADLDDVEVARAVVFMANQSGAKFKEPEVKAAPAAAAAASASAEASAPAAAASAPAASAPAAASASASAAAEPAKAAAVDGKKIYDATCQACHAAGVAGAPKFGDKAAWADRIKAGKPALYEHALKGFQGKAGMMPAKGGSTASDDEVKAAVDYMAAAAK
ncbi:MAG: cytochrome c5 family protein [Burkholderiales bacterium]|nr:cytochrome c5 family protein [Burkholderiales bacterium]